MANNIIKYLPRYPRHISPFSPAKHGAMYHRPFHPSPAQTSTNPVKPFSYPFQCQYLLNWNPFPPPNPFRCSNSWLVALLLSCSILKLIENCGLMEYKNFQRRTSWQTQCLLKHSLVPNILSFFLYSAIRLFILLVGLIKFILSRYFL